MAGEACVGVVGRRLAGVSCCLAGTPVCAAPPAAGLVIGWRFGFGSVAAAVEGCRFWEADRAIGVDTGPLVGSAGTLRLACRGCRSEPPPTGPSTWPRCVDTWLK